MIAEEKLIDYIIDGILKKPCEAAFLFYDIRLFGKFVPNFAHFALLFYQ